MPDQLSLAGFPREQQPTDRLFFGVFPDAAAAGRVQVVQQQLCAQHRIRQRPFAPERLHITLFKVGDYIGLPQGHVRTAREAAATVARPPFEVVLDRAGSFSGGPGHLPFVLLAGRGEAELTALRQALLAAVRQAGLNLAVESAFTPHVTLLRNDHRVPAEPVDPVGWPVHEFALVHSLLGQTRYIVLGRWPLRG